MSLAVGLDDFKDIPVRLKPFVEVTIKHNLYHAEMNRNTDLKYLSKPRRRELPITIDWAGIFTFIFVMFIMLIVVLVLLCIEENV